LSRLVSRAENWEKVYTALQNINFAAFDYNTVKQSILDYVKLYFPETFNDFIESSEFIAIVETFAYVAELMAYRFDVDAHENFITTAQRNDSILRLAKYISYTASRPLPARGLVKITSVSTTERINDSNGNNLANRVIRWNDTSNSAWKDQFIIVMNRALVQDFGTVSPTDRFQVQDILFELYSVNTVPLASGVFSYSTNVSGQSIPMELVPVANDSLAGIVERRPVNNGDFSILYGQDGLGDGSDTTGFFSFTKQGSLQRYRTTFDGITPNLTYTISTNNINDTDIWINNVDPVTGKILNTVSTLPYLSSSHSRVSGEWVEVDVASAQNVLFNSNPIRTKYEVETLASNQARVLFGDGELSNIPSGTFDIWARSSLDQDIIVPQSAITNTQSSFTYVDAFGVTQTFTFTFSLISSLQNASAAETMEHVRTTAPSVYYSQDRMVNGQDYNSFMLQDPSILKLRAVNRTFAGDSKYMAWHDPSGTYEDVKVFSDDGMIYFEDSSSSVSTPVIDSNTLITTYMEPLLSSTDITMYMMVAGVPPSSYSNVFTTLEKSGDPLYSITVALAGTPPVIVQMYYNTTLFRWYAVKQSAGPTALPGWPGQYITQPLITISQPSIFQPSYNVTRATRRLIFQSPTTAFWSTNSASTVVSYDTLNSDLDEIDILQANVDCTRTGILTRTWRFGVLGQEIISSGVEMGLPDVSRLSVLPVDEAQTGVPVGLDITSFNSIQGLAQIVNPKFLQAIPTSVVNYVVTLPLYYVVGVGDITLANFDGTALPVGITWSEDMTRPVSNAITVSNSSSAASLRIEIKEYVYLTRLTVNDPWAPAPTTTESINSYVADQIAFPDTIDAYGAVQHTGLWERLSGRSGLNFMWLHHTPSYYLVDPAASNLIDFFIITKGYYLAVKQWLSDPLAPAPKAPTALDLRTTYGYLLNNAMISDTVVLNPGNIKILFGPKADPILQASFLVIRSDQSLLTDNQIKTIIVAAIQNFFDISYWELGETFFATELIAMIHMMLPADISSVTLVPALPQSHYGNLFQIAAREDEVFYPDISVDNIQLVSRYTTTNLNI
jgi:hypothetical protein